MINLNSKFEVFTFTDYEDMKGNAKCKIWDVGGIGVIQGHRQCHHSIERLRLSIQLFFRNYASILCAVIELGYGELFVVSRLF